MGYSRLLRVASFQSPIELPKKRLLQISRAHSAATTTQQNPTDHGHGTDQLDLRNLRQSILCFGTKVPVETDPHVRRRWSRTFIVSSILFLAGCVAAIEEFERDHQKLQLVNREDCKRLVRSGDVLDSQRWKWYDDNLVLSGDYPDRGKRYTLFTHVFLAEAYDRHINNLIWFSLFFRAAWVAGFGKIGTPVVVVGSGVAEGLAFLYAKDHGGTAAYSGASAVVSGLMAAATVARPRMPLFIG